MTDDQEQRTFADLFADEPAEAQEPQPPEPLPEEQTPETLPLIRTEEKKLPLIFSERSPVPTRGGEPEQNERRKNGGNNAKLRSGFQPLTLDLIPTDASLGQIMKLAREYSGYSLEEIRDITHISERYLIAMENDDQSALPLPVYVSAYLRTLSGLYHLPEETAAMIHELFEAKKQQISNVSPELIRKVNAHVQINEAEERRINRIFTTVAVIIGLAIMLGIWAVVAAVVKHAGAKEQADSATPAASVQTAPVRPSAPPIDFDQTKFEQLNAPQMHSLHVLEMSEKPAVKRK